MVWLTQPIDPHVTLNDGTILIVDHVSWKAQMLNAARPQTQTFAK